MPPVVLVGGGILTFFVIQSMISNKESNNQYLFFLAIIAVIMYILSKGYENQNNSCVTPGEARWLVEQEMYNKLRWGHWSSGTTFRILPVCKIIHRDACGMHYNMSVEVLKPYIHLPEYWSVDIMMRGVERGFVSFIQHTTRMTGREQADQKTILPGWFKSAERSTVFERLVGKIGKF